MSLRRSTRIAANKTDIPKVQTSAIVKPKTVQKKRDSQTAKNTSRRTATPKAATARTSTSRASTSIASTSTSRASSSRQSTSKASASKLSTARASTSSASTSRASTSIASTSGTSTSRTSSSRQSALKASASKPSTSKASTTKAVTQKKKSQASVNVSSSTQTDTRDVQKPSSSQTQTITDVKSEIVDDYELPKEVPPETGFYEPEIQVIERFDSTYFCDTRSELEREFDFNNSVKLWSALESVAKQFLDDGVSGLNGLYWEIRSVQVNTSHRGNQPQMLSSHLPELFNYHLNRIMCTSQPSKYYFGHEGEQVNTLLFLKRLETAILVKTRSMYKENYLKYIRGYLTRITEEETIVNVHIIKHLSRMVHESNRGQTLYKA
uniref:Zonadhesin n=1 Tax=Caenorhabditis tropicalis TaxID=1561998 RepID=A0A1I7TL76_9PELO